MGKIKTLKLLNKTSVQKTFLKKKMQKLCTKIEKLIHLSTFNLKFL